MSDKRDNTEESKDIRLLWGTGDDLPLIYANQLLVSHATETEFHIVFGQLSPPIIYGLSHDELPDKVEIKPVVKIVVTPEVMQKFVDALNKNIEIYESKKGDSDDN